jgi:hypothetical protein
MLGNTVSEPFFEDFQDQAFEESHFAAITFPIYSVEVELHVRSKCCTNLCYAY